MKKKKKYILLFAPVILLALFFLSFFLVPLPLSTVPYSLPLLDTNGKNIGELKTTDGLRHQKIVFEDIPKFTKDAILTMEDASFYQNIGIDFSALVRATYKNIEAGEVTQGGSTISTQLIKNLFWLNEKRTLPRKALEMYLAIALNLRYTKDEILTSYLENIYFGYQSYGLRSASQFYFGKEPNNLTQAEQIALLVIPKNSNLYDPFKNPKTFEKRFLVVSEYLAQKGLITKDELQQIQKERLLFVGAGNKEYPYLNDFFRSVIPNVGEENTFLQTTIDSDLQDKIETLSRNSILPLAWKNVGDFAVVLVDRDTMELKALIGGKDYSGTGGQVNAALAPRQVGSTIKPFTYLLAFQNLGYTPETTISDVPTQFLTDKGYAYTPKNYSLTYKGEVTLAEALSQSINIPATKIAEKVGVKTLLSFLRQLGISTLDKDEEYYGLALTLGVGEISLYELTQAYSIFAKDGDFCQIQYVENITGNSGCTHLVDSKYTAMVNEILSNRYIKLEEFPLYGNLDFADKKVTLKTGTSRNFKDNWTVGFTNHYLIGVWVGNKDGLEMKGVSGATGAGEIFKNIVDTIETSGTPSEPSIQQKVSSEYLEITSPLPGSIYQIDASKPLSTQKIKLKFETNIVYDTAKWFVDEKPFSKEFYEVSEGIKTFSVILEKDGKEVGKAKSTVQVLREGV